MGRQAENACQRRFETFRVRKTLNTMADIREGIVGIKEPERTVGLLLVEFYESMKSLESDPHRGGKQATAIVMAMDDILRAVRSVPLDEKKNKT